MHIARAKENYSTTSRRYDNLYTEMTRNIQAGRLARSIPETCLDDNEDIVMHKTARVTMITYETASSVLYEAPVSSVFQEKLFYVNGYLQTSNRCPPTFLNPMTSLEDLLKCLMDSKSTIVQEFMRRFRAHEIGIFEN